MSGIEIAGVALGIVPVIANAFKIYSSLLGLSVESGDDLNITRIKLLTERARFESFAQQVSKLPDTPSPIVKEVIIQAVDQINREFSKIDSVASYLLAEEHNYPSFKGRLRWGLGQSEKITKIIMNLRTLNDSLFSMLPQLAQSSTIYGRDTDRQRPWNFMADSAGPSRLAERGAPVNFEMHKQYETDEGQSGTANLSRSASPDQEAPPLFRLLVNACQEALSMLGAAVQDLHEISLSFRLWTHTLASENIYAIFTDIPHEDRKLAEPDISLIQYQALIHLAWTLYETAEVFEIADLPEWQHVKQQLLLSLNQANKALLRDSFLDPYDAAVSPKEPSTRQYVLEEISLTVETVMDALPCLVHLTRLRIRAYGDMSLTVELPVPTEVTSEAIGQLLDTSVSLIEPADLALAAAIREEDDIAESLDKTVKAVFDKQAAALKEWKDQYGSKIGGKLTSQDLAKWESIAESVFVITLVLNKIPALVHAGHENSEPFAIAEKLLKEYSCLYPHLGLNSQATVPRDIKAVVEIFKACVESLVALEVPIDLVEPPPPYQREPSDKPRVLLDITDGQIVDALPAH